MQVRRLPDVLGRSPGDGGASPPAHPLQIYTKFTTFRGYNLHEIYQQYLLKGTLDFPPQVGLADYLLASEETEPGHGWDYRSFNPEEPTPAAVASAFVDAFVTSSNQLPCGLAVRLCADTGDGHR